MTAIKRLPPFVVTVSVVDDKTGTVETLTCAPEHPLYVQGQCWMKAGSIDMADIADSDKVLWIKKDTGNS